MFFQNLVYVYNDEFYYISKCFSTLKKVKKEVVRLNGEIVHEKIFRKDKAIVKKELKNLEDVYKKGKRIK